MRALSVLVCDNYDSFTFNLVQYLGTFGAKVEVVRNDHATVEEVAALSPDALVISPGPGRPEEAGISVPLVGWSERTSTPLLGVCLGHQAIGVAFGGRVVRAPRVMHGKTSPIHHAGRGCFAQLPSPLEATRYHSLVVDRSSITDVLEVTAQTSDGLVMGLRHVSAPIEGVQFHPESILTEHGMALLANFLAGAREGRAA